MITFGYKSKFSGILRSMAATAIGLVMIFGNNATLTVVKIIAAFLCAAGVVTFVFGLANRKNGSLSLMTVNAVIDIVLGLLMFFSPSAVADIIVYVVGVALLVFGIIQVVAVVGASALLGGGFFSLAFSILAIGGGILLVFNPWSMEVMSILAGVFLVIYGISDLASSWKVHKAKVIYEEKAAKAAEPDVFSQAAGGPARVSSSLDDVKEAEYHKVD